ncbi:hypothetical protein [uncultured Akkermansia sp.]|uniref:hypothetical protein n=1 Tax=uncultured Akkermansia sp. TaxID=512294 RepID=UPI00265CA935|nr:hypothetical protein [uncultured Akkermansia sp.]
MKQSQQKTASFSWLTGLRWSFAGYVAGTLLAAGAGALDFPVLARGVLLLAAVCFAASLVCAGACIRSSKAARWYLLLVLAMMLVAVLFGRGDN